MKDLLAVFAGMGAIFLLSLVAIAALVTKRPTFLFIFLANVIPIFTGVGLCDEGNRIGGITMIIAGAIGIVVSFVSLSDSKEAKLLQAVASFIPVPASLMLVVGGLADLGCEGAPLIMLIMATLGLASTCIKEYRETEHGAESPAGTKPLKWYQGLKWYQWLWAGLPFVLVLGGGALGGLFGGIAVSVNIRIFQSCVKGFVKFVAAGLVFLVALECYFAAAGLLAYVR